MGEQKTMDSDLKAKWVEALRSGDYAQAKHQLKNENGFCCLGVLCDVQGADFDAIIAQFGNLSLSCNPSEYLGELGAASSTLSAMNDNGKSFAEIADYIEANL